MSVERVDWISPRKVDRCVHRWVADGVIMRETSRSQRLTLSGGADSQVVEKRTAPWILLCMRDST